MLLAANDMIEENTGASPTPHNPLINPAISAAAIHKTIKTPKKYLLLQNNQDTSKRTLLIFLISTYMSSF